MKSIDLDASSSITLIAINDPIADDGDININVWGYQGQSAIIDIGDADIHEVNINLFEVVSHNYIKLKFALKKHAVKIKNLVLKYAGVDYSGGAEVLNLEIITNGVLQTVSPGLAKNIRIQTRLSEDEEVISNLLKSVEIIPGCGESALHQATAISSLTQMKEALPSVKQIAPVVAWFADSLDISKCQILPGIEPRNESVWKVSKYDRSSAHPILYDQEGNINYGGSIRDQSVGDFLSAAKEQGFNIIFYPLIMVDVARKPWRGHMTAIR